MNVSSISSEVLGAACGLLQVAVPELSPTRLVTALREYEPEGTSAHKAAAPPRMLSKHDAAGLLAVSKFTVQRMIDSGQLPALKIGIRSGRNWKLTPKKLHILPGTPFTQPSGNENTAPVKRSMKLPSESLDGHLEAFGTQAQDRPICRGLTPEPWDSRRAGSSKMCKHG